VKKPLNLVFFQKQNIGNPETESSEKGQHSFMWTVWLSAAERLL